MRKTCSIPSNLCCGAFNNAQIEATGMVYHETLFTDMLVSTNIDDATIPILRNIVEPLKYTSMQLTCIYI